MTTRPTGSVSLMFTDIEGSTKLLERLRERYAVVLEEHRDILRGAFERHGGFEVDTQGDSFFVAFGSPAHAIGCALDVQRELSAHIWPEDEPVRVRIGIHTGAPTVVPSGYIGIDVNRGARIGAAAHGGQVLLSEATRDAADTSVPSDVVFERLGVFRFKGLAEPLAVFELRAPGLATDFPQIRTSAPEDEPPADGEPPYKGLLQFEEEDADRFFGRESLVEQLVATVREQPFLAVVGASGSGKSSLIRAGVIAALRRDSRWRTAVMTPTADPPAALAAALGEDATPDEPTVLVVDQFEEVFTLCHDAAARTAFVNRLMRSIGPRLHVLLTLRADFYAEVAQFPELRAGIAEHQVYVGPMEPDDLRRAIEQPARLGGWDIAHGLVDLLLRDVGSEPGALPLLSHALLETWRRRRGSRMTLKGYFESGEVRGAIARTADRLYADLAPEEQQTAREILLRLTELGEGTQDTRRRAPLDELVPAGVPADAERTADVLRRLVEARLITVDEGAAEVAHEALIREWPMLRDWLHEDREGLRTQRQIAEAVTEWQSLGREPSLLFRGARLATAREWADAHARALNAGEQAFVDASIEAEERDERERADQQRRELEAAQRAAEAERLRAEDQTAANRRLRRRAFILAGLVVVAAVLGVAAILFAGQASEQATIAQAEATRANEQRDLAEQQRRTALSRQLAAQANGSLASNMDLALLLAIEANRAADTVEGRASLLAGVVAEPALDTVLARYQDATFAKVSPDARTLAFADTDGNVHIWDLVAERQATEFETKGTGSFEMSFSADGGLIALSGGQPDEASFVEIRRSADGAIQTSIDLCTDGVAQLSPAGDRVLVDCYEYFALFDATTGERIAATSPEESEAPCSGGPAAFSHDGARFALGCLSGSVTVYDSRTGIRVAALPLPPDTHPNAIEFSDDGSKLAIAYQSGVDFEDPESLGTGTVVTWSPQDDGSVTITEQVDWAASVLAFAGDAGDTLLTVSNTGVDAWDVSRVEKTGSAECPPTGSGISPLTAVSADSRIVAVPCGDGIRLFDLPDLVPRTTLHVPGIDLSIGSSGLHALTFASDARRLISVSYNDFTKTGAVWAWDIDRYGRIAEPLTQFRDAGLYAVGVRPDLSRIATVNADSTEVGLWDPVASSPVGEPVPIPASDYGPYAYFSADGSRLAVGAVKDRRMVILDSVTGSVVAEFDDASGILNSALSSDGGIVALGSDTSLSLWDVGEHTKLSTLDQRGDPPAAFSPDGTVFAIANIGGTASLFAAPTLQPLGTIEAGHEQRISNVVFSPDGKRLATMSLDQTAKIWDVVTRQQIGQTIRYETGVYTLLFSPVGNVLATALFGGSDTVLVDELSGLEVGTLPNSFIQAFSSDGKRLATTRDGEVVVWDLDPAVWIRAACHVAARNLSAEEWARYLGDEPYRETCPGAPIPGIP